MKNKNTEEEKQEKGKYFKIEDTTLSCKASA
jgi:hypothetical protein